jgi:hypothetical protein
MHGPKRITLVNDSFCCFCFVFGGVSERDCLTAFGDSADDAVVFDVVGVVGLDVGCETVEGALDGFFGGGVHHAGLLSGFVSIVR